MPSRRSARTVRGAQEPRISHVPEYASTSGDEAVELAALAGLHLDPWEALVLRHSLGERVDGKWAAFEVGLCVSRQNGKGAILEARELAGLFLLGERLIIHSAHQFDTSLEHFRRLLFLVENTPELSKRVKRISRSHGEEGIELTTGQRIRFRTRTKGGGRGFSGDLVVFDEAMDLPTSAHGAILPTLSAQSEKGNPQVWYTGSAVDQWIHEHGVVFARVRERGLAGDEGLSYFEWSVEAENPSSVGALATDPAAWAQANPGLGIRISAEHVSLEQRSMDARTFAVERLGVGDWPDTSAEGEQIIPKETWAGVLDNSSAIASDLALAFDVSPDRGTSSIASCGLRADGTTRHIEVVDRRRGTGWVVTRLVELIGEHDARVIACDEAGPAGALLSDLRQALADADLDQEGEVVVVNGREYAQACGNFYDGCDQQTVWHRTQPDLDSAVKGAAKRQLGEAWAWSRKNSTVDITPLVAVTLALWGLGAIEPDESLDIADYRIGVVG